MSDDSEVELDNRDEADPIEDNQHQADPETEDSAPESDADSPESNDDDSGSLTTAESEANTDTEAEQAEVDWKSEAQKWQKQYEAIHPEFTRRSQKLKQYERFGDVDLDEAVRHYQTREQRQQMENLPAWSPQSPNYQRFQQVQSALDTAKELMQHAESPEEQEAIKKAIGRKLSPEDQKLLADYNRHQQEFTNRLAQDPYGTLRDMMAQVSTETYSRQTQEAQAYSHYYGVMNDPKNKPLVEKYWDDFQGLVLNDRMPVEKAVEFLRYRDKSESLQNTVVKSNKAAAEAQAQKKLAKAGAVVERDTSKVAKSTNAIAEAYRRADELGIPRSVRNPRFVSILNQVQTEMKSQE